jgi:hypothetical protein
MHYIYFYIYIVIYKIHVLLKINYYEKNLTFNIVNDVYCDPY